jgi:hypothetical protein
MASWRRVDPPAVAFFYTPGGFHVAANIWAKEPAANDGSEGNPAVSQAVWGDPAFELVAYLDDVEAIDVALEVLKAALGYEAGYSLGRGTVVPSRAVQEAIIAAFGTAEAFRGAIVGHVGTHGSTTFRRKACQSMRSERDIDLLTRVRGRNGARSCGSIPTRSIGARVGTRGHRMLSPST